MDDVETPLARILREQGRQKQWLAEKLGCQRDRVTRLCAGNTRMLATEAVAAAEALGVEVEDLLPVAAGVAVAADRGGGGGE